MFEMSCPAFSLRFQAKRIHREVKARILEILVVEFISLTDIVPENHCTSHLLSLALNFYKLWNSFVANEVIIVGDRYPSHRFPSELLVRRVSLVHSGNFLVKNSVFRILWWIVWLLRGVHGFLEYPCGPIHPALIPAVSILTGWHLTGSLRKAHEGDDVLTDLFIQYSAHIPHSYFLVIHLRNRLRILSPFLPDCNLFMCID